MQRVCEYYIVNKGRYCKRLTTTYIWNKCAYCYEHFQKVKREDKWIFMEKKKCLWNIDDHLCGLPVNEPNSYYYCDDHKQLYREYLYTSLDIPND